MSAGAFYQREDGTWETTLTQTRVYQTEEVIKLCQASLIEAAGVANQEVSPSIRQALALERANKHLSHIEDWLGQIEALLRAKL